MSEEESDGIGRSGKRILMRAGKGPFDVVSPEASLTRNTIATNIGNLVFSHATFKLLGTPQTEIVPNEHRVHPADAPEINERYDAFVVPLANAFRPGFDKHLLRLTELIERLDIPVVVFGVGAQASLEYDLSQMAPLNDLVKRFVAAVLDRSPSIGVRGELTETYLKSLGFNAVDVIGCPSMFLYGDALRVRKAAAELAPDARISINVSPHTEVAPYFEDSPYAGWMGSLVTEAMRTYPDLVYIPQEISALDLQLYGPSTTDLGRHDEIPRYASHPLYSAGKVRFFVDPWTWISYLADFDFVFGTRIHGNISALLAGTPAFVIAHDSRTLELARYFDLPHRKISELPEGVDAARLYAEADFDAMNAGLPERFTRMLDFMARHDLDCAFGERGGAEQFDAELAELTFPPAVEPLDAANAKDRLRSLRDENVVLTNQVKVLTSKVTAAESTVKRLNERTKDLESVRSGLQHRMDQLEAIYRGSPYGRLRRLVGRLLRRFGLR